MGTNIVACCGGGECQPTQCTEVVYAPEPTSTEPQPEPEPQKENYSYCGYYLDIPLDMAGKIIFYIGGESSLLVNLMMSYPTIDV